MNKIFIKSLLKNFTMLSLRCDIKPVIKQVFGGVKKEIEATSKVMTVVAEAIWVKTDTILSRVYRNHPKHTSNEQQFYLLNCLIDVRGQRSE